MKRLLKVMLIAMPILCVSINIKAQSGWNVGNYYQNRGGNNITCGQVYYIQITDRSGRYRTEAWQNCREMVWYQEYYEGYIYLWGSNGWYQEYRSGYYWYYVWNDFQRQVG